MIADRFRLVISTDAEGSGLIQGAAFATLEKMRAATKRKLIKASAARRDLAPGSSRARVTSANARYMRAAEAHDRIERAIASVRGAITERAS